MNFIKKIRDDRRGLAIELAMMVMVVTFAVSILITTVALLQVEHSSSNMQDVKRRYELEQIGADYVAWVKAGAKENEKKDYPGFKLTYIFSGSSQKGEEDDEDKDKDDKENAPAVQADNGVANSIPKDAITPGKYTLIVDDENGNLALAVTLEVSEYKDFKTTVKIIEWELN
jgi:hypothetical protein